MTITGEDSSGPTGVAERALMPAAVLLAIAASAWGSGAFGGTPVEDAGEGAFASDATLLAPAPPAFGIWALIYLALGAFAVVLALPRSPSRARLRAVARPLLTATALGAVWIAVVQREWLAASVGVLAGVVVALGFAAARLARARPSTALDAVVADAAVGLYLGWASIATVANVTAVGAWWWGAAPEEGMPAAVGVLVAAAFLGIAMARDLAPSPVLAWTAAAAFAWGLVWIGEGRLFGTPDDAAVGWTALGAAAAVVTAVAVTTVAARMRAVRWARRHRPAR